MPLLKPTKFMKEYYEKNGELSYTDEEWKKIGELIIAMQSGAMDSTNRDTTEEVSKRRMKICLGCPHFYIRDNGDKSCRACGCDLSFKTLRSEEQCPEHKWNIDVEATIRNFKEGLKTLNKKRIPEWYQMLSAEESEEILANERR